MKHWWHLDRTGDKELITKKGNVNAVHGSDAQVEGRDAAQRVEEGAASQEPEAGSGDHAVGEAGSEEETGVSG